MSKSGNYEVSIHQSKSVARFGWFWEIALPEGLSYSGYAFTLRGARRKVTRTIANHKATNRSYNYHVPSDGEWA